MLWAGSDDFGSEFDAPAPFDLSESESMLKSSSSSSMIRLLFFLRIFTGDDGGVPTVGPQMRSKSGDGDPLE